MKNELGKNVINYTDQNGEFVQATVVNYFKVGNEKYVFYTKENLENKKENDSVALSIAAYNEEKGSLSKIEMKENQNMALNIATIIGNYSSDIDIDLDMLKQKVNVFDFEMLPLMELSKESIIEEAGIIQKMAPYKYVENMENICNKASERLQQETINVNSELNISDDIEEPLIEISNPEHEEIKVDEQINETKPLLDTSITDNEEAIKLIEQVDKELRENDGDQQIVDTEIVVDDETIELLEKIALELKQSDEQMNQKMIKKSKLTEDDMITELNEVIYKHMAELENYRVEMEVERSIIQNKIFDDLSNKFVQPLLAQVSKISSKTQLLAEDNKQYKDKVEQYQLNEVELKQKLESQKGTLDNQQMEISDLQTKLDDEKIANSSHVETIKARDEELRRKEQIIEKKDEDYNSLQRENEELKKQINKLNSDLNISDQNHKKDIFSKDEEIKSLKQQSEIDKNTITNQTNMIETKNTEIRDLTDQLREASQREFAIKQAFGLHGPEESSKTK